VVDQFTRRPPTYAPYTERDTTGDPTTGDFGPDAPGRVTQPREQMPTTGGYTPPSDGTMRERPNVSGNFLAPGAYGGGTARTMTDQPWRPTQQGGVNPPAVTGSPGDGTSGGYRTPGPATGGWGGQGQPWQGHPATHPVVTQLLPMIQAYFGSHPDGGQFLQRLLSMIGGGRHTPTPPTGTFPPTGAPGGTL